MRIERSLGGEPFTLYSHVWIGLYLASMHIFPKQQ